MMEVADPSETSETQSQAEGSNKKPRYVACLVYSI